MKDATLASLSSEVLWEVAKSARLAHTLMPWISRPAGNVLQDGLPSRQTRRSYTVLRARVACGGLKEELPAGVTDAFNVPRVVSPRSLGWIRAACLQLARHARKVGGRISPVSPPKRTASTAARDDILPPLAHTRYHFAKPAVREHILPMSAPQQPLCAAYALLDSLSIVQARHTACRA